MSILLFLSKNIMMAMMALICFTQQSPKLADLPHKSIEETKNAAITRVEPTYSTLTNLSGLNTEILIEILIDEEGNVSSAYVLSSHPLLKESALAAAGAWKFRPLEIDGMRKKMVGRIRFEFKAVNSDDNSNTGSEEIESLKRQVLANPNSYQPRLDLARAYRKQHKYLNAIAEYEQAIKLQPDNEVLHYEMGETYVAQGKLEEAVKSCEQAIKIKPDYLEAYYELGWTYRRLDLSEKALEVWNKVLAVSSDLEVTDRAYSNLATLYEDLGRVDELINAYKNLISNAQKLRAQDPEGIANPVVYAQWLASLYEKMGRNEEAIVAYSEALALEIKYNESHSLYEIYFKIGSAYEKMGDNKKAISSYKKSISLNPDWSESHVSLCTLYLKLGDKKSAMNEYNILKKIDRERADKLLKDILKE